MLGILVFIGNTKTIRYNIKEQHFPLVRKGEAPDKDTSEFLEVGTSVKSQRFETAQPAH